MSALFGTGFNTMEAALAARERLQATYASNIANADTPHAHADTRTFEDFLADETRKMSLPGTSMETNLGNDHNNLTLGRDHQSAGSASIDGNNVDMQKEMAGMVENQLMHDLTLRLLKGKLDGLANVITTEGR